MRICFHFDLHARPFCKLLSQWPFHYAVAVETFAMLHHHRYFLTGTIDFLAWQSYCIRFILVGIPLVWWASHPLNRVLGDSRYGLQNAS